MPDLVSNRTMSLAAKFRVRENNSQRFVTRTPVESIVTRLDLNQRLKVPRTRNTPIRPKTIGNSIGA